MTATAVIRVFGLVGVALMFVTSASAQEAKVRATLLDEEHTTFMVAFSSDGKTLASSHNGVIHLWDVADGKKSATVKGHLGIYCIAFSPDGKLLAWGGQNERVELWDLTAAKKIATLEGLNDDVRSVAFSPDSKTLAASAFQTVKLWNVETKKDIATLKHNSLVKCVAFSPNGKWLACGLSSSSGGESGVRLWEVATGMNTATLEGGQCWSLAFSPDSKTLALASWGGSILLWDVATAKKTSVLGDLDQDNATSLAFSPGGTILATALNSSGHRELKGKGNIIRFWDITTGKNTAALELSKTPSGFALETRTVIAISRDGRSLATAAGGQPVRLWDLVLKEEKAKEK